MSQSTSDQLKLVSVGSPLVRVLLVVPIALALLYSWYATRWYVGNFVAEYAPQIYDEQSSEAELAAVRMQAAQAALRLAPNDPLTHRNIARLEKVSLVPEELNDALRHYEEAVRLSPNDYSLWMELGRTREQAGDAAGGEKALRRAIELAPYYAYPRWYLGNLLLRTGRGDEAFVELRRAADAYPTLRGQIFNAAWVVYGENVDAITQAVGGSADARAELALYVAARNRFDDALRLWSSLTPAEKKAHVATGKELLDQAVKFKQYRKALTVFRDLEPDTVEVAKPEQIINPGFEMDVDATGANIFSWKVTSVPQAQIAFDPATKESGARSLRITFRSPSALTFEISQLVVVEPATQYHLQFYVRTEDLKSAATPFIAVTNSADGSPLGASPPLPAGTHDWQLVAFDFKTPPGADAVTVRVTREACGADTVCPIFGIVWYDDFTLQRAGGTNATGARYSGKTSPVTPAR